MIQGLWIGPRLSRMEELSIRSFLAHGHDYHLYTYNRLDNVPSGVVLKDANDIVPAGEIFKYQDHDSYAGFADYFRYTLLLRNGGWWVDTDLICLRPFDFDADYVFSSEHVPEHDGGGETVNIGAIKALAGAPIFRYASEMCRLKDPARLTWGETGPRLMAEGVERFGLSSHIQKATVFCPLPWFSWMDSVDPARPIHFAEGTYAIHLWNEMWRRSGFNRDHHYDPDCLYECLHRQYMPSLSY